MGTLQQPGDGTQKPHTLRNMWLGFAVVATIVLAFTAFTMWSRWQENQDIAAKVNAAKAAADREAAEKTVEVLGGTEFKIISFYAMPGIIRRGDTVHMCYGVSNAKSVTVDPPVGNVWPSVNRCMEVTPKKTTTYTFTADDGKGNTKTAQLTLEVR